MRPFRHHGRTRRSVRSIGIPQGACLRRRVVEATRLIGLETSIREEVTDSDPIPRHRRYEDRVEIVPGRV